MIQTKNLWKTFGRHDALRGLSLSVPAGSAYALVGANGAGKTTTLRVLMNILEPDQGTATVLGVDSRRLLPRELAQIGYVSENQEMPKRLTVSEYLAYLRPFYSTWDKALETSLVKQLRLPPERKIGDLSHGMRMKMALACALPFRPKLLILDEPLSGMDALVRDEFMAELLQQAGEMTVVMSSHELHEIEGFVTHVGYMDRGKLRFEQSMSDLSTRFREVRLTLNRGASPPRDPPKEWLNMRAMGNVIMFVDCLFSEDRLAAAIAPLRDSVRTIEAKPMSLRSIFTALALDARERG